jgi:hypothetical protein
MCRCQPVHARTSYSSSPVSPLASSKQLSIRQRWPAIRTRLASDVSSGARVLHLGWGRVLRPAGDFSTIATIVSLYGLFADAGTIRGHLSLLAGILPGGVLELIGARISLIVTQGSDTLSVAFIVAFLVALWSANSGVAAIFDALNVVYREKAYTATYAASRHMANASARRSRCVRAVVR